MLQPTDLPPSLTTGLNLTIAKLATKTSTIKNRDTLKMVIERQVWDAVGSAEFHNKLDLIHTTIQETLDNLKVRREY